MFIIKTNDQQTVDKLKSWAKDGHCDFLDKDVFGIEEIKKKKDVFNIYIDSNTYVFVLEFLTESFQKEFYVNDNGQYIMDLAK